MKIISLTIEIEVPDDEDLTSMYSLLDEMEDLCSKRNYSIYDQHWEECIG